MPALLAQLANRSPDSPPASFAARPEALASRFHCGRRPRRRLCKDAARSCAPPQRPQITACAPNLQTVLPIFLRQRLAARPSSLAPRSLCVCRPRRHGALARDGAISPCTMPHCLARASHSDPAASEDAACAVGFQRCSRFSPKSPAVLPILRRQRLVARPAALALRLRCVRGLQSAASDCAASRRLKVPALRAHLLQTVTAVVRSLLRQRVVARLVALAHVLCVSIAGGFAG